jgi:hypothetical protein
MDQLDIIKQLDKNINRNSALDVLLQVDSVLDSLNIYAYKNWIEGEIVDGPHIERYWVTVTLMYPHKLMPDPAGAERILAKGGKVFFAKDELITAAKLVTPDDVADEPDERRPDMPAAKKIKRPIWLITLELPRNFLDSMTSDKVKIDDLSIDTQTVEDAYDDGLGDDDALRSD